MEALTMIKKIIIMSLLFLTIGCNDIKEKKMNVIYHGTKEFDSFVKQVPISLNKAYELSNEFYKNNKGESKEHFFSLYFIVNDYYVFSPYVNLKIPNTNITGIWVDSKTGEVKYIENDTEFRRKSQFGWSGWIKIKA